MTTRTVPTEPQQLLESLLHRWENRRLLQRFLWGLPWVIVPSCILACAVALIAHLRPFWSVETILILSLFCALGSILGWGVWLWITRRSSLEAARRFDVQFGFGERLSTALELLSGRIHSTPELVDLQLADAQAWARGAHVKGKLPLQTDRRGWFVVILLLAVLALLLFLPSNFAEANRQNEEQAIAIEEASETLREITENVVVDPALNADEREQLLQVLETTQQTLERGDITPQEALASLLNIESQLQSTADTIQRELSVAQSALDTAGQAIQNAPNMPSTLESAQNLQEMLAALRENAEMLNAQQSSSASEALQEASDALEQTQPNASSALQNAAEALENGSASEAQSALEQAENALQQAQNQSQQRQESAEMLQDAVQQAQQSADSVSESSQSDAQTNASQENQSSSESENAQQSEGESGETDETSESSESNSQAGETGQQGQEGEQGQTESNQAQSSNSESAQSGSDQTGAQQSSSQQSNEQGEGQGLSGAAISGAGDQTSNNDSANAEGSIQGQVDTNNSADGEGESNYQPIYSPNPQRLNNGTNQIDLTGDSSNSPIQEGNFSENPEGTSTVPYNQVFNAYLSGVNNALNSDRVPLALRDLVRSYFSSIAPPE